MRVLMTLSAMALALCAQNATPPQNAASEVKNAAPPVKMVHTTAVQESDVAHKQMPAYPPDAIHHHVQGVVKISVRIGNNGKIEHAGVISGNRLLTPAAMQALKEWTFRPTEVAGHAVRVVSTITFSFTLDGSGNPVVQNVWPAT
jgi:TonB family protein